jgi:hypothetical protein
MVLCNELRAPFVRRWRWLVGGRRRWLRLLVRVLTRHQHIGKCGLRIRRRRALRGLRLCVFAHF